MTIQSGLDKRRCSMQLTAFTDRQASPNYTSLAESLACQCNEKKREILVLLLFFIKKAGFAKKKFKQWQNILLLWQTERKTGKSITQKRYESNPAKIQKYSLMYAMVDSANSISIASRGKTDKVISLFFFFTRVQLHAQINSTGPPF